MQRPVFGGRKAAKRGLPNLELAFGQTKPCGSSLDPQPRLLGELLGAQQRHVLQRRPLIVIAIGEQQGWTIALRMAQRDRAFVSDHRRRQVEGRH